jgi:hypothetical protein
VSSSVVKRVQLGQYRVIIGDELEVDRGWERLDDVG